MRLRFALSIFDIGNGDKAAIALDFDFVIFERIFSGVNHHSTDLDRF